MLQFIKKFCQNTNQNSQKILKQFLKGGAFSRFNRSTYLEEARNIEEASITEWLIKR